MTDSQSETGEEIPLSPRQTPNLIGHDEGEARFLSAWRSGRLPHAWLISGPRGIGKASFAFRVARFALSEGGNTEPAGLFGDAAPADSLQLDPEHPIFRRIASGAHPDLMTLERSINPDTNKLRSSIAVDDVRKAGDFMRLTASEGGWRVVIVDSVDELNTNAANALLKVLEEPPERALLLLVSHAPGRLLATIRSRCCRLTLKRLPDQDVADLLAARRPGVPAEDRLAIARLADGSPGKALSLVDDNGLDLYRGIIALMTHLPNPPVPAVHAFGDTLARNGAEEAFRMATELMAWWIGRVARSGARGQGEPVPIIPEEQGCGSRLLNAAGVDRWMEVWEKINRLSDQIDRLNLDRKQALLSMFHALQGAMKT